jgi:hypothetical protein
MKKLIWMVSALLMVPVATQAMVRTTAKTLKPASASIPAGFSSMSKTETLEWGCPVADVVEAENSNQALHKIKQECIEQVRKAAALKPGVFDVLETNVIWPDVRSSREQGRVHLKGTIFLETLVLRNGGELR